MFMAVLGHDLRNPVGAVVTIGMLLAATQDPAVVRESAERLRSIGTRMGRMINDLLDLARARQGDGIPIGRKSTELRALVNRVVDELRLVHPDREVAIDLPGQPMTGQWDEDRLSQLVENLVANALKHGPAGRPVSVTLAREADVVVLCVANAGHIDAELLPQLFDPFRSGAEHRPRGAGEGTGSGALHRSADRGRTRRERDRRHGRRDGEIYRALAVVDRDLSHRIGSSLGRLGVKSLVFDPGISLTPCPLIVLSGCAVRGCSFRVPMRPRCLRRRRAAPTC
jgi:light-regulated signal transduction histidine kinase (bacteriophytochrome)